MAENDDTDAGDNLVGETLGDRYEILRSLDRGGMGTVYLAQDKTLERQVVVKIPHANLMADRSFRLRFLQEIRDLSVHEHPAILSIVDSGSHGDVPYAVVQYLSGGNLRGKIQTQGGRQSREQILEWLPTIADALDTVHKNGSLHRDVKPANILFDGQDNAILSDFGIATAIGAADPDAPTQEVRQELTVVGTFVGSPAYAPPEAIDRILTPAYDQYSLATVVYLAVTGELPFSGNTNEAILIAKEKGVPPKIDRKKLASPLSKDAEKALIKALARQPEDRFASCTEFADAFASESNGLALPIPSSTTILRGAVAATCLVAAFFLVDFLAGFAGPGRDADQETREVAQSDWPITVELGSTPEEIDRAVFLCENGGGTSEQCARQSFADERSREVTLTAYSLDPFEVTNAEFAAFVDATGYETTAEGTGRSWDISVCRNCSWRNPIRGKEWSAGDHPNHPVVHVSWRDARAYCEWTDGRLPTEDEWEFAARGKARRTFPWGDAWDVGRIRPIAAGAFGLEAVGSHPEGATPEGIQDLAGSVWEWTSTPSGDGERRIFKGGSWMDGNPAYFRSALFAETEPDYSSIDLGIRCARDSL